MLTSLEFPLKCLFSLVTASRMKISIVKYHQIIWLRRSLLKIYGSIERAQLFFSIGTSWLRPTKNCQLENFMSSSRGLYIRVLCCRIIERVRVICGEKCKKCHYAKTPFYTVHLSSYCTINSTRLPRTHAFTKAIQIHRTLSTSIHGSNDCVAVMGRCYVPFTECAGRYFMREKWYGVYVRREKHFTIINTHVLSTRLNGTSFIGITLAWPVHRIAHGQHILCGT